MEKLRSFTKSQYYEKAELVFKLCYLCLTFISFNTFFARQWYLSVISYIIVAFAVLFTLLRLIRIRDYFMPSIFVLVLLWIAYIFSSINTMRYGYIENIQALAWMFIQYFLVFAYDKKRDEQSLNKERNIIFIVVLIYTSIAAIIAFVMMITGYSFFKVIDGYNIFGGFVMNRLFGIYMDCNYGAVLSIISIILSLKYYKLVSKKVRILLIVNIILEYLFVCYSDSRTGLIAISITAFIYFITTMNKNNVVKSKKFWKNVLLGIGIAACVALSVLVVKEVSSMITTGLATIKSDVSTISESEQERIIEEAKVGRYDNGIAEKDGRNVRFLIWESAIDLFKAHPILGVSFRNNIETAQAEMCSTFIVGAGYDSMHNFAFDVLSSQGIVGTVLVVILMVISFVSVGKNYNRYEDYGVMLSIIAAIFVSMLFYSESFYMNTPGAFIFWYVLGYMVNYRSQKGILLNG